MSDTLTPRLRNVCSWLREQDDGEQDAESIESLARQVEPVADDEIRQAIHVMESEGFEWSAMVLRRLSRELAEVRGERDALQQQLAGAKAGMTSSTPTPADVADAATLWISLRDAVAELAKRRAAFVCEREEPGVVAPCWKVYRPVAPDDAERLPEAEWCQPCRDRERVHEKLKPLAASRGAWLRILIRRGRKAQKAAAKPQARRKA